MKILTWPLRPLLRRSFGRCVGAVGLFATTIVGWAVRPAQAQLALKAGDRFVFLGASITEFGNYTRPVEAYIYGRYPGLPIRFYNAGWSGNVTADALGRLNRDVLSLKPTVVSVCIGTNDGRYTALTDEILATYRKNLDAIVRTLVSKKVRVFVFTPGGVDYDRRPALRDADYNKNLEALGAAAIDIAKKYGCPYGDMLRPMLAAQSARKATNPNFTMLPDGVHPDDAGGLIMAGVILKTLGAEPMPPILSTTAAAAPVADTVFGTYRYSLPPQLIPVPVSTDAAETIRAAGQREFFCPKVVVVGLPAGMYGVRLAGMSLGPWSNEALAAGVPVPGSYSERARRLYDLTTAKDENYLHLWRGVRLAPDANSLNAEVAAALMRAGDDYQAAIDTLRAPETGNLLTIQSTSLPPGLGANVALHKPYDVSDPNRYNYGIGGLTDGSWDSNTPHVFATGETPTFPKTATIDLGQAEPVRYVVLGVPPFGSTKTVEVSASADGVTYTKIGTYVFSLRQEERHVYAAPRISARYIRLTYVDHYPEEVGYNANFAFTSEVEAYAGGK
jgi:lysophospholipase L1-like esterase